MPDIKDPRAAVLPPEVLEWLKNSLPLEMLGIGCEVPQGATSVGGNINIPDNIRPMSLSALQAMRKAGLRVSKGLTPNDSFVLGPGGRATYYQHNMPDSVVQEFIQRLLGSLPISKLKPIGMPINASDVPWSPTK